MLAYDKLGQKYERTLWEMLADGVAMAGAASPPRPAGVEWLKILWTPKLALGLGDGSLQVPTGVYLVLTCPRESYIDMQGTLAFDWRELFWGGQRNNVVSFSSSSRSFPRLLPAVQALVFDALLIS